MEYTELGNTGISVSVAGLGCGGFSKLGLGTGGSEDDAANVVRTALDQGVNFIDTAAVYGTQGAVGKAIVGRNRDDVVISTKSTIANGDEIRSADEVVASLDDSLKTMGVDYVDVFHLHAVRPNRYDYALDEITPALLREQEKGKFRELGITESSPADLGHDMLARALKERAPFKVMMLAHNMMHQSAATTLYPQTLEQGVGTLVMFAVRRIFANSQMLSEEIASRIAKGELSASDVDQNDPVGFLLHATGANSVIEAAYRFCRHEPGADVVLFGTGNVDHVSSNVASLCLPPLPKADAQRLRDVFGRLVGVGIEFPTQKP